MAKQLVNPFERHVEKGVLALAGILLIGVIAKFLVTTPNRVELAGEMVPPGEIDRKVAEQAEVVRRAIANKTAAEDDFQPLFASFAESINPFTDGKLVSHLRPLAPFAPEVPTIDPPGLTHGKTTLADIVKLPKPMTTFGRSTIDIGGNETPVNWVTVSAVFDRDTQRELQLRTYGSKWIGVIFGPAELQRRQRRDDGSWSDEDWQEIETWPMAEVPKGRNFALVEVDGELTIKQGASVKAQRYKDDVEFAPTQLDFIRPMWMPHVNGTPWKFPIITSITDVARHDWEYLSEEPPDPKPDLDDARYPTIVYETDDGAAVAQELTGAQQIKAWSAEAAQLLEKAKKELDPVLAIQAFNLYTRIQTFDKATPSDKAKAIKRQKVAEEVEQDIRFRITQRAARGRGEAPGAGEDGKEKVDFRTPKQQLWAHDASPGSLEDGETYQYRIRPVLFNPLYGIPGKFEEPTDAQITFLKGSWSEPTDPVTVAPAVEYFVKRGDQRKNLANIEVYQWFKGVWVMNGRLKAGIGSLVAGEGRADIPSPFVQDEVFRAPVPFSAEATIVDIDFDRSIPEYKKDRNGVRIGAPKKTTAVVFVDAQGRLHERFESLDKSHPGRKRVKDMVFRAPKGRR